MKIENSKSNLKNVPKLRFSEFGCEWEEMRLKKFLKQEIREISKPDNLYMAIGIRSHFKGTFQKLNSDPNKIAMEKLFVVKKDDLIVNITFAWEGALAIAKQEDEGGLVSHRFPTYIFQNDILTSKYFKYIFPTKKFKYILQNISPGGAGRNRVLNKNDFLKIKINLPVLSEQQKIADFLGSVDEWIENLREQKDILEKYKKGIMQKIFSQEIRFKDDNGNDFPEWEEKRIDEVFEVTRGYVLAVKDMKQSVNEKFIYPVYSSQTSNNGLVGFYKDYLFEDAITWTTDGANAGEVNFRKGKFYCTNVCGVLINREGNANKCISEILNSITKKYVSYVGNPKLMNNVMSKIKIKFPLIEEQKKIAVFLLELNEFINVKDRQIEKANRWKKGLMQQLFV